MQVPHNPTGASLASVSPRGSDGTVIEFSGRLRALAKRRPTHRTLAVLALLGANLIWGTTFVATKPMLDRVPPLTLATARFAVALLVLLPLLARTGAKPARGSSVAVMGFTGVFLVYLCQNVGLQYTSAANGALVHGGIPIFAALIAAPVLRERITWARSLGICSSLAGVAIVVLMGGGAKIGLSVAGDTLVLGSALALAAYFVLCRLAFPSGNSLALVAGVTRYGLLFLVPAGLVELLVVGMARPTFGDLLGLLYLGVAASALAFVLWGYGLGQLEAAQATVFANLNPLVGLVVAALLLGEPITSPRLCGGMLIVAGVWIATSNPARLLARVPLTPRGQLPGASPITS